jgi:hypothetical protein
MAMLEMDVAALSPPQMKRLLEVMRERGQHELGDRASAPGPSATCIRASFAP